MENASKALIIAGAILLSILLISLGIMIFNNAANTVKNSGMSDAEIQVFNQKFTKYEGKQKGSIIRSLVQEVMANNNSSEASDETQIPIYGKVVLFSTKGNYPTYSTNPEFKNTQTYTVSFKYTNGRISEIDVN